MVIPMIMIATTEGICHRRKNCGTMATKTINTRNTIKNVKPATMGFPFFPSRYYSPTNTSQKATSREEEQE